MKIKNKLLTAFLSFSLIVPLYPVAQARHLILRQIEESGNPAYRIPKRGIVEKRLEQKRHESYSVNKNWFAPGQNIPEVSEGDTPVFALNEDNINRARRWPMVADDRGGTLLLSSSPEYVNRPGILYEDIVCGKARLVYYHVNDTELHCRMAVIVENFSESDRATISVTKGALGISEDSYIEAAKRIQYNYINDTYEDKFELKPGERTLLHRYMDQPILNPGQLAEGFFDFESDEPVRISVVMLEEHAGTLDFMHIGRLQAPDQGKLRGSFPRMERYLTSRYTYYPETDGIIFFTIGDDRHDQFKTGYDAPDLSEVINYGNYGVNYHIKVDTKGYGRTHYYLRPLGGMYAGTVLITHGWKKKQEIISSPDNDLYFGVEGRMELSDLGSYENDSPVEILYTPPPGSNLPVQIILVPEASYAYYRSQSEEELIRLTQND